MSELQSFYRSWIDGSEASDKQGEFLPVNDKFCSKVIARVALATAEQLEQAIESGLRAFSEYSRQSIGDRAALIRQIRLKLELERDFFEKLIVSEAGKPIQLASQEVDRCLLTLEAGERECLQFSGEMIPSDMGIGKGKYAFTQWVPAGLVLGFTPFNFPLNLALHKIVPALASGCSIILKPSPHTPISLLCLARLIAESGAMPGLVNVVCCSNEDAARLVMDSRFSVFSFTGSAQVGWHLRSLTPARKVMLELGGNAPVLIDETADIELAARLCAKSAFAYAGQVCISTQRVLCHSGVYNKFLEAVTEATKGISTGDPSQAGVLNGPMINKASIERLENRLKSAISGGAQLLQGGNRWMGSDKIFEPTLLTNVPDNSEMYREEAFAPVLLVEKSGDFNQSIIKANSGIYGLQCGVFTEDIAKIKWAFKELQFGAVLINLTPNFRLDHMPYGGVKQSGLGREGIRYAMEEMSERRLLVF